MSRPRYRRGRTPLYSSPPWRAIDWLATLALGAGVALALVTGAPV